MKMLKKVASLTLAIGSTLLFTPLVKAEPSQEIVDKCMKAADFEGCIRVFSGKKPEEKKMTIDIDKVRTSGNSCPSGFGYLGSGQCQKVACEAETNNDPRLGGKGWWCRANIWGRPGLQFKGQLVQATTNEQCPLEEPEIGKQNSCWNRLTEDEIKSGIIMGRVPPISRIDDGTLGECNKEDKTLITNVYANTPASEAGVKVGEIILSVDSERSCEKFLKMNHSQGQTRTWNVKGVDGSSRQVSVTYREVLIPEQLLKINTKTGKVVD